MSNQEYLRMRIIGLAAVLAAVVAAGCAQTPGSAKDDALTAAQAHCVSEGKLFVPTHVETADVAGTSNAKVTGICIDPHRPADMQRQPAAKA